MKLQQNMTVLSEEEMNLIHMRVMETLDLIGIRIEEEESLKVLEEHGARIDWDTMRAYMPPDLVNWALQVKADSFTLYDADGERAVFMGGDIPHHAPLGYSTTYVDIDGVNKEGTYDALLKESMYVDSMDEYEMMHPSIQPCDKPEEVQDLYMLKAMLVGTKKPIHCVANSGKNAEAFVKMHAEIVGGIENVMRKPRHMFNLCTFSPLGIRRDCAEVIRTAAKYNVPCMFSTGTMAGATAPVTLAGSMVESLAEVIGHTVLAQVQRPGLPVAMLHASRIFDMKFAACTVATPEFFVMKVAACQMANFYKIPIGEIGLCSDSDEYDVQYGWEKFATSFIPRQAGMNMIFGGGMFSQLNQFGFAGLAIDTEIIRVEDRTCRGIEINEETVAFSELEKYAETGDFIKSKFTRKNFKNEFMTPIISDRTMYSKYETEKADPNGRDNLEQRAIKYLNECEARYSYTKGKEHEAALQAIIDEYSK